MAPAGEIPSPSVIASVPAGVMRERDLRPIRSARVPASFNGYSLSHQSAPRVLLCPIETGSVQSRSLPGAEPFPLELPKESLFPRTRDSGEQGAASFTLSVSMFGFSAVHPGAPEEGYTYEGHLSLVHSHLLTAVALSALGIGPGTEPSILNRSNFHGELRSTLFPPPPTQPEARSWSRRPRPLRLHPPWVPTP